MEPKPIIYGSDGSPPVRSVFMMVSALGLKIDYRTLDVMNLEHKELAYTKLNPQQTIPTLVDVDGKVIWDSHVINTYLLQKYGGEEHQILYPKDLYVRSRIDQRLHFDCGVLYVRLREIVYDIFVRDIDHVTDERRHAVLEAYDTMERFLRKDDYMVGGNMTVADLSCITTMSSLDDLVPLNALKYPNTRAWMARMNALSYYYQSNARGADLFINFVNARINELRSGVRAVRPHNRAHQNPNSSNNGNSSNNRGAAAGPVAAPAAGPDAGPVAGPAADAAADPAAGAAQNPNPDGAARP